jgi:hypothetical protein
MNQVKHNLFSILLIIATIGVWHSSLSSHKVIAQASLVPAPSLQDEPIELLTSETDTLPTEVQSAVLNDAVKRTSKTVAAFKVLEAQPQQWSDGCLGLGKPEEICTQTIISGWQVVVTDGIKNWTYRTDDLGNAVRLERRNGSSK